MLVTLITDDRIGPFGPGPRGVVSVMQAIVASFATLALFAALVVVAYFFVRFLLVATKAAQLYISRNEPPRGPASPADTSQAAASAAASRPAAAAPAAASRPAAPAADPDATELLAAPKATSEPGPDATKPLPRTATSPRTPRTPRTPATSRAPRKPAGDS